MKINKKHETARQLRVIYKDSERLELGKQLAASHQELAQVNSDLESVRADFKARISAHEAKIGDLSNKVGNGWRVEEVKCIWQMDTPKKLQKTLFRVDTQEIVEVADMTQADIQGELPLDETKKTGVAGDGVVKVEADS